MQQGDVCGTSNTIAGTCCPIGMSCSQPSGNSTFVCMESSNLSWDFAPPSCTQQLHPSDTCGTPVMPHALRPGVLNALPVPFKILQSEAFPLGVLCVLKAYSVPPSKRLGNHVMNAPACIRAAAVPFVAGCISWRLQAPVKVLQLPHVLLSV